jgi:hypothetical protein
MGEAVGDRVKRGTIMSRVALLVAALLAIGAGLAACGGGQGTTAATPRYSSARQVIAVLAHGGLPCTGASYGTPVVSGATSEASCSFGTSANQLIDVFPGTVTTAMVLRNSVSTGTEKIWSDVGPNWWVQTSSAYVRRVQKILGGRIIGGPWHPPATPAGGAGATYPNQAADAALCKTFNTDITSGDTYDIQTALQQAAGLVSPKLARDIQAVVNGTTFQQDLHAQVKVAIDCGLVQAGVSPGS